MAKNRFIRSTRGSRGSTRLSGSSEFPAPGAALALLLACCIAWPPPLAAQQGECVELRSVTVAATALLDDEDAQALVEPFLGDCISADLVRHL